MALLPTACRGGGEGSEGSVRVTNPRGPAGTNRPRFGGTTADQQRPGHRRSAYEGGIHIVLARTWGYRRWAYGAGRGAHRVLGKAEAQTVRVWGRRGTHLTLPETPAHGRFAFPETQHRVARATHSQRSPGSRDIGYWGERVSVAPHTRKTRRSRLRRIHRLGNLDRGSGAGAGAGIHCVPGRLGFLTPHRVPERDPWTHTTRAQRRLTYSAVGGQTQGRVFTFKKKKKKWGIEWEA